MAAFLQVVCIMLMVSTIHTFRIPFYKNEARIPFYKNEAPIRSHLNDYNAIPVTLDGKKYIMMNLDDSDADMDQSDQHQGSNKFVRFQLRPSMMTWDRNPETYNNNNDDDATKNLLFYKGDDGNMKPVPRNRFTDWVYGLFSKFQKAPPAKKEPNTTPVIVQPPVVTPPLPVPVPGYAYENTFASQQNYQHPPNVYPYPYPYYPNYQYGHNFNPYSGKPNRHRPSNFDDKNPPVQAFASVPEGSAPYSPYPPFQVQEISNETLGEEEEQEEPQDPRKRGGAIYVMPNSKESTNDFVWLRG